MAGIVRRTGSTSRRVEAAPWKGAESLQGRGPGSEVQTPLGRKELGAPLRLPDEGPVGSGLPLDADAGALREGGQGEVVVRRRQGGGFFLWPGGGDDRNPADEGKTGDQGKSHAPPGPDLEISTQHGRQKPRQHLAFYAHRALKSRTESTLWRGMEIPVPGARV
jgi:hypothetical protein